jgi:type IX secretion system PorP/SprF family membrane protein
MLLVRIVLASLLLAFTGTSLWAQEVKTAKIRTVVPLQYQHNFIYLNPAFAGSEGKRELSFTGHRQDMPISPSQANGLFYYHAPSGAKELQTGIGVVTSLDYFSPYTRGKIGFIYARALQVTKNLRVAGGVQVAGKFLSINYDEWRLLHPTEVDIISNDSDVWPDLEAGIWINWRQFFMGGSILNLLERKFDFKADASRQEMREGILTGGFKLRFADNFYLTPSALVQKGFAEDKTEVTYQATTQLKFLLMGVTYRGKFDSAMPWLANGGIQLKDKYYLMVAASVPAEANRVSHKQSVEANLRIRF